MPERAMGFRNVMLPDAIKARININTQPNTYRAVYDIAVAAAGHQGPQVDRLAGALRTELPGLISRLAREEEQRALVAQLRADVAQLKKEPYEGCAKRGGVCDCGDRPCFIDAAREC